MPQTLKGDPIWSAGTAISCTVYCDRFGQEQNGLVDLFHKDDLPGFKISGTLPAQSSKRGSGSISNKEIVKNHRVNLDRV